MRLIYGLVIVLGLIIPRNVVAQSPEAWVIDDPQTTQDTVMGYMRCYADWMGLIPRWQINVLFQPPEDTTAVATTLAQSQYLMALIRINEKIFQPYSDHARRQTLVHELWHIPLWELGRLAIQGDSIVGSYLIEQVVSEISHQPIWQRICQWTKKEEL